MALPVAVIVGRPNVGKSSLLNALAGEMISIVEPTAGVTRDRISTIIGLRERYFELVDTGGYGIIDADHLAEDVTRQIRIAMRSADLVIFMTDIRTGLTPLDKVIADILRRENLDVIGVANKADSAKMFPEAAEFSKMGFGSFLCISATNNINKSVLLDKIGEKFRHFDASKPAEEDLKIAITGKRNAGKSTLVNAWVGCERVIVSEIPGTTRDSVDVGFEHKGRAVTLIDTAGARKKRKIADSIEFYSHARTNRSIHRAGIVLLVIDAAVPVSTVDKKLARLIASQYKACIIVVNKWDLARETASPDDYHHYLTKVLPHLKSCPIVFTIAIEKANLGGLLDLSFEIFDQANTNIPTPRLNKAFELLQKNKAATTRGIRRSRPKIYYATQIAVNPVTILMFVNDPRLFEKNYMRYIENSLKSMLSIGEVPLRLLRRPHRTK